MKIYGSGLLQAKMKPFNDKKGMFLVCCVEKGGLRELFRDIIIILQANMLFVCASLWNITKYVHKTLSCSCCFWSDIQKFYVTAHASPCQFPTSSGAGPCQHPQTQNTLLLIHNIFSQAPSLLQHNSHFYNFTHMHTPPVYSQIHHSYQTPGIWIEN